MYAIKNIQDSNDHVINITHINSIAAITDHYVLFHSPDRLRIEIESIKKTEIIKSRSFIYNLLVALCALPLIYILVRFHFTLLEKILIGSFIIALLGIAIKMKSSRYTLFISKFDMNIEFDIHENHKEDAKKIVKIINKKVKSIKQYNL